ncbi:condensation domain-containing protein [Micromonospora sp. NPDC005215]|uniref:condensation domain-containing protein n=1 Tax=Micromonospora sp. NPDC005215 TaxID=3157024 RepID=UPI0033BB3236
MSAGQEALWLAHQLDPGSRAYNLVLGVRVRTPLRTDLIQGALTSLVGRHELLRSRFPATASGRPERRLDGVRGAALDTRELPDADDAELASMAAELGLRPFDITVDAAFRLVLLRRRADDAVLVVSAHHIVTDATSQWLILHELLSRYAAAVSDREVPVGTPVRWDDEVRQERDLVGSARGEMARKHWEDVYATAGAAQLLTDRPRPTRRSLRGGSHRVTFPGHVGERMVAAAAEANVTVSAWMFAALQVALHRCGAGPEFLIGSSVSTRSTLHARRNVGYYVNVLPVRAKLGTDPTFRSVAGATYRQMVEGLAHSAFPTDLVDSRQAMTVISSFAVADRLPVPGLSDGRIRHLGLDLELIPVPQQEGQLDLMVETQQSGDVFSTSFSYDADLFESTTVERLAEVYLRIIEASLTPPDVPISRIPLVRTGDLAFVLALGSGDPAARHS